MVLGERESQAEVLNDIYVYHPVMAQVTLPGGRSQGVLVARASTAGIDACDNESKACAGAARTLLEQE